MSNDEKKPLLIHHLWMNSDFLPASQQFSSELSQLNMVRDFIHKCCQIAPGDVYKLTEELQLAINEAFCNVVIHSYQERQDQIVMIASYLLETGVFIQLSDQGKTFNPEEIPKPDFQGGEDCGFGWYIINTIADKLAYIPKSGDDGWNHLRIFKHYFN